MAENFDVIAKAETFIDTVHNDLLYKYTIEGFKILNKDRINRRGGGVALYVGTCLCAVAVS